MAKVKRRVFVRSIASLAGWGFISSRSLALAGLPNSVGSLGEPRVLSVFDFMEPEARADTLSSDPKGDHTFDLQTALDSGAKLLEIPSGAIFNLTRTLVVRRKIILKGNGELRFVDGLNEGHGLECVADGCEFNGLFISNPKMLGMPSGKKSAGIYFKANRGKVSGCTIDRFQSGIQVDPGGEYDDFIISNNFVKDVIGAGDGSDNLSSTFGEDRGDGITIWGARATIVGNNVTAMLGRDCRIGIHLEGLSTLHPAGQLDADALGVVSGNVVTGPFRRGIAVEAFNNATISGNAIAGATWWGISVTGGVGCVVSGNAVRYTRADRDRTGFAWRPIYAGILVFGGAQNAVVSANSVDSSGGFCVGGIVIQGLVRSPATTGAVSVIANGTNVVILNAPRNDVVANKIVRGSLLPDGLVVTSVSGVKVSLSDRIAPGIHLLAFESNPMGSGVSVTSNTVIQNSVNKKSCGLYVMHQSSPSFIGNTFKNCMSFGVYAFDVFDPLICENMIGVEKGGVGINLEANKSSVTVNGNRIMGPAKVGLSLIGRTGGVVVSNSIEATDVGIDLPECTYLSVTGNSISGAVRDVGHANGIGISISNNVNVQSGNSLRR